MHDSNRDDGKENDEGKCYNTTTSGEKVLYDDESRNMKELLARPEEER